MKQIFKFLLFFSFCSSLICCKNISSNLEKETIYFSLPIFPTELEDEKNFDYHGIKNALCGKTLPENFSPKRILVIQMAL